MSLSWGNFTSSSATSLTIWPAQQCLTRSALVETKLQRDAVCRSRLLKERGCRPLIIALWYWELLVSTLLIGFTSRSFSMCCTCALERCCFSSGSKVRASFNLKLIGFVSKDAGRFNSNQRFLCTVKNKKKHLNYLSWQKKSIFGLSMQSLS